jgi:anti-anti-sigma factor
VYHFEIQESQDDGWLHLRLSGELDLASASALGERLDDLRAGNQQVCLDLSNLDFMDSSGIALLVKAVEDARQDGWALEVAPELSPQVDRVLELTSLKGLVIRTRSD